MATTGARYGGMSYLFRNLRKKLTVHIHVPGHHCDCVQGSDEDAERQTQAVAPPREDLINYRSEVLKAWDIMWELIVSDESEWKKESGTNSTGGVVHSRHVPIHGKVVRLQGVVDLSPEDLFNEIVIDQINQPKWNPTVTECRTLQQIDENTDVSYNVTSEAGGGLITSRDFVTIRHWGVREGIYMSTGIATTHMDMPPQKKFVRGENGPGGWAMRPIPGEPNKCTFIWLLNTNLKGWLPQRLIDQSLSTVCLDMLSHVRKHADTLNTAQR